MIDTDLAHQIESAPFVADLSDRLHKLSAAAFMLSPRLSSEDLKHRCSVLASGAQVAAGLLVQMPLVITAEPETHQYGASLYSSTSDGIETRLLYQLGWSAMELGLKTEALAVLQMVGTLLHGKVGGSIFKVESLLALGKLEEAAALYKAEMADHSDDAALADAIFSSLWSRRGDASWNVMKMRASQNK